MSVKTVPVRQLYSAHVKLAQTMCPGSMSAPQYAAFVEHFKGRDIVKSLKLKSANDATKLAMRETTASRDQKLAASIACDAIATALGIERNKFWSRKLYAFVSANAQLKPRKRAPRTAK